MIPLPVLIADDEALLRQALRLFVDSADDLVVVGEARTGLEAVTLCAALSPAVVLMDIRMPGMSGIEATAKIVEAQPEVKVLAVTTFSSEQHVVPALRAGATGYLVKDTTPEVLLASIRDVHEGKSVISPRVSRQLVESVISSEERIERLTQHLHEDTSSLTPREHSVIQLLAKGMSNAEIGRHLHLSEATIKANLRRVMHKWNVRDRVQVLIRAAQKGIVSL
ncbi:MAG: response regulator [Leucobacter sp.]